MNRLVLIVLLLAVTFRGGIALGEQPSVLMINVDDWNDWNEVLVGHPQVISPNIKRLAERGVTFSNAICASPSCVPSRPAFFTGIAPSKSGNISNDNGKHPWRFYVGEEAVTMPRHFSQNGWESIGVGKNFHSGDQPEFDQYFKIGQKVRAIKGQGLNLNTSAIWGVAAVSTEKMPDYLATSRGIEQIRESQSPLFLSVGIYRPHVPWVVPQEY
ncbi:MAG: sulfatase-like hydrolase/transferase, partial [Verrucomicrobiota bacterium]